MLAVSCLKTHVDDPATICSWPRGPPWEQSSSLPPHGIHRPGSHCCSALVQGAAAAQPEEKSKHRPFVERLPPLRRSKTRTLSLHVRWSTVGSAGATAMGLSGELRVPGGAVFFPGGGWRLGESWVAICGRAERWCLVWQPSEPVSVIISINERRCAGCRPRTWAAPQATV